MSNFVVECIDQADLMLATGNFELKYYCVFWFSVFTQLAEYEIAADGDIFSNASFTSLVVNLSEKHGRK